MFNPEFEQHLIDTQEEFLYSVDGFESEDLMDIAEDFQSTFCGE
jgi:hypothetical protein